MKILYVEDNEDNIYMLQRRLTRLGYEVDIARDGKQGIEQSKAIEPDLIIMDLGLPVIDGWSAIKTLKSDPETAQIPIIALTAHAMSHDRQRAFDMGCDDFDTKPVNMKRLQEKIEALLNADQDA